MSKLADKYKPEVKAHDFSGTLGALFKLCLGSVGDILLWIGLPLFVLCVLVIAGIELFVRNIDMTNIFDSGTFLALFYAGYFFFILVVSIIPIILVGYMSERYLGNRNKNLMAQSIKLVFKRFLALLGTGFLAYPAIFGATLLLYVPGIILMLGWSVTPQVVLLEKLSPIKALKRSWELTKGSKLPILGLYAVCYGISYVATLILMIPAYIVMMVLIFSMAEMFSSNPDPLSMMRIFYLFFPMMIGAWLIQYSLNTALFTVVYYNLRIRNEGFVPDTLESMFSKPMEGAEL